MQRLQKSSLGRITCLLTVCADGTKLPPLLCFRGRPCGPIEKKELPNASFNYPKSVKYTVQMNAWTDERVMLYWVDHVLTPYVKKAPPVIIPYVMLDKYSCHHQGTVVQRIESLGVEWDIIPGGCTALVQPIDVRIGKPFKNCMRYQAEEWLMDLDWEAGKVTDCIKPVEVRQSYAKWCAKAWKDIPIDVVYN